MATWLDIRKRNWLRLVLFYTVIINVQPSHGRNSHVWKILRNYPGPRWGFVEYYPKRDLAYLSTAKVMFLFLVVRCKRSLTWWSKMNMRLGKIKPSVTACYTVIFRIKILIFSQNISALPLHLNINWIFC